MSAISLELFKKHVRADSFAEDDDYMRHLLDTATETVIAATNRTCEELSDMNAEGGLPSPLVQAALMLAGHWYNQREAVSGVQMHEVPYTLQALINPYTKLTS